MLPERGVRESETEVENRGTLTGEQQEKDTEALGFPAIPAFSTTQLLPLASSLLMLSVAVYTYNDPQSQGA